MKNEKKILSTREVVASGLATLGATAKPTLVIALLGMVLPQVLLSLVFDAYSGNVVRDIQALFDAQGGATTGFLTLVAPAISYMSELIGFILLITLVIMVSYFALVHVAVAHQQAAGQLSAGRAWLLGMKTVVPKGVIVLVCLLLLTVIGQVLIAPAVLVAVMSLAIPVILVTERKGAFRSLWEALTLRYVRQSVYSGWAVLFMLLSLAALFYTVAALVGLLSQWLLIADQKLVFLHLSRLPWVSTFAGQPFGPIYLGITILEAAVTTTLMAAFPALTAALYFLVVGRRDLGQA